ncbi:hypothetical protein EUZ85_18310 [Hahella sp. KA22]|uniref:BLF1 family deaminating toxin n=1 Tax=Hahella sp. KA22 TaxID=1628392 RepID=UPI000FDDB076|nr:BLF1 family deaminating toxin [Hahella sp. KA22]AZZ92570.1 hypothetical protein ENC22_15735 [Hahella sp. KA22]QAY55943.1 hypothetical protein EUZ85_18310 [Hahella sp. KA22]
MWNELERVISTIGKAETSYTTRYFVDVPGATPKGEQTININALESSSRFDLVLGRGPNARTVLWLPWQEGEITRLKLRRQANDYWFVTAALSGCTVGFNRKTSEVFHYNGDFSSFPADLRQTSDFLCPLQRSTGLTLDAWAEGAGVRSDANSRVTQYGSIVRQEAKAAVPPRGHGLFKNGRPAQPAKYQTHGVPRATVIGLVSEGFLTLAYQDASEQGEKRYPWYEITTAVLAD